MSFGVAVAVVLGLVILGIILVVLEVLVIPGFGLIGILGAASIAAGGYVAYVELHGGAAALAVAGGVVGSGLSFWLFSKTRVARSLNLETQTTGSSANPDLALLVGTEGEAITPLRPSGTVDIEDRSVDVVTDGEYVESGTRVRVVRVEGSRVIVEPVR